MNATEEIIDVTPTREMIVAPLFGTTDPAEIVVKAETIANVLMQKVRTHTDLNGKQDLVANIRGKEHICVGGWTLLGSLVGVFPVCVWTKPVENGWEARVEARTMAGVVVGAAEAECLSTETSGPWRTADDYALRSMAQTRATSKALRMPLGFIVSLAGFESTPSEEMDFAREQPMRGGQERPSSGGVPTRPPVCKVHGAMAFRKAGVAKASGKPYESFWGCTERTCKVTVSAVAWDDQLRNEAQPKSEEVIDHGDLPFEE